MTLTALQGILDMAQQWADGDPEPATAEQLRQWIARRDEPHLRDCFDAPLLFGTAGLRGVVGPGPAHMNLAVLRRVTRALAEYVSAHQLAERPLVIGHDARLDSARFAREAIAVARAARLRVYEFGRHVPTPLVAYASQRHKAAAGVVVTASHNPREYNGYKVYGPSAIQIVSPIDSEIAERMNQMPPACRIPLQLSQATNPEDMLGEAFDESYVEAVLAERPPHDAHSIRIAYTPLHGVGWNMLRRLFLAAGHADLHPVPNQVEPDGRFPTVAFPNPEEPGTLDLGMQYARQISAHVLIANDPDADRLALALPDEGGQWHALTGNQLGAILTDYLLEQACASAAGALQPLVVTTIVSTPMVDAIARARGACLERTMTGFKWLWTAALELLGAGSHSFAIAWEEALGYSTHTSVRDKDGIAAGLIAADWVAQCNARGILPWHRLGELYRQHGAWASRQVNVHCTGADGAHRMHAALNRLGASPPAALGKSRVARFDDYRTGAESRPFWRGTAELFGLNFEDHARLLVRPSGTEPKLKLYVDVPGVVENGSDPFRVLENAGARAERLARDLVTYIGLD